MQTNKMSRRMVLAALASVPAVAASACQAPAESSQSHSFVLVHGAWHGGWCWGKVTPLLHARGARVYAPTMTGLGERSHLASLEITLDTHIRDIEQVLTYEDLTNVVLVGHSYAGIVITGVANRATSRIAKLVYLDAFLPENGQSFQDMISGRADAPDIATMARADPTSVQAFGVTNAEDAQWVASRLVDQPIGTLTAPVSFSPGAITSRGVLFTAQSFSPRRRGRQEHRDFPCTTCFPPATR